MNLQLVTLIVAALSPVVSVVLHYWRIKHNDFKHLEARLGSIETRLARIEGRLANN